MNRPRHPANPRVRGQQAAAAAGGEIVLGRAKIARALNKSPRTVTRWYRAGVLLAGKIGPAANNLMIARAADLAKVRS